MYYRARYFDPAAGTFVSEDPLGFGAGDENLYRYVFNSPTNFTDPDGKTALILLGAAGANPLGLAVLGAAGIVIAVKVGYDIAQYRNDARISRVDPREFDPNDINKGNTDSPVDPLNRPQGNSIPKDIGDPNSINKGFGNDSIGELGGYCPVPWPRPDYSDLYQPYFKSGPIPAPESLPAFPGTSRAKPKTSVQGGGGLRKRWKDGEGNIYEWDSQHGTVEKYNRRGKHQGEFDPVTGEQVKSKNKDRKVEP